MKVDLPEEIVEFMKNLAQEINTQDNRATRDPYYYVVRGQRETAAPAGTGSIRYYVSDTCTGYTPDELKEHLREMDEEEGTTTDFDEFVRENCEEYSAASVYDEENVFLTFKGYEQHMKQNGHNYRHLDNVSSFVKYAGRNPEMEMLHKAIMAFGALT